MGKRLTLIEFIDRALRVHGGRYSYSKAEYVNNRTTIEIVCHVHESFWQIPNSHLNGAGCPHCANELRGIQQTSDTATWVKAATEVREGFDYSKVVYSGCREPVTITCLKCLTQFDQDPNNHLSGAGCPNCCEHGYSEGKAGYLYILQSNEIVKVGITNKSPVARAKYVSKSAGKSFKVICDWKIYSGSETRKAERNLLKLFKTQYSQPTEKFHGSTECFIVEDIELFKLAVQEEVFNGYIRN